MAKGKVVADGPAREVFADKNALSEARVVQPQLVAFYQLLKARPSTPYVDYLEARRFLGEFLR